MNVIIGSNIIEQWQGVLIQRLLRNDKVKIQTVLIYKSEKLSLLYRSHQRFESFLHDIPQNARSPVEISSLGINKENIVEDSLDVLNEHPSDVLINLSNAYIPDSIVTNHTLGMWYYYFGTNNHSSVGFQEVVSRSDALYCSLRMQRGLDVKVLYESWSPINAMYVHKTANSALWKSMCFVERSIDKLPETGRRIEETSVNAKDRPIRKVIGYIKNYLDSKLTRKKFTEQWVLAYSPKIFDYSFKDFKFLIPPGGRFWADPFLVKTENRHFVFVEEFGYPPNHIGKIVCLTLDENMEILKAEVVLKKPYHLSYPFVFELGDHYYMIPETSQNKTIELYRAKSFPDQWEFVMNLASEVDAVDTTLLYHDSLWWMFTNMKAVSGASTQDELFLFYAENPITQHWTPHPQNPVVSDVRVARPAGKLFTRNGKLFRPSQNSSYYYGYGLNINEVKVLSKENYVEELVESFRPDWNPHVKKLHTLNFVENLTMIDVRRKK